ncbi:MAG TPA: cysteine--tRNA ligase [Candidatus Saccharimonadales bacterium]
MSDIYFHNTPTNKKETFRPIHKGKVALYTCGPTVYSTPHIGNFVAYIRWDILVRMLIASGFEVTRVMNITDVGHLASDADEGEDKMLKGAKREGISMWDVAQRYTDEFMNGAKQLNLITPTFITKATDFIPEQIELIKQLEKKGFTYSIDDGVYFDTGKFPHYADFAHLDLEGMKAGARVDYNNEKRSPHDFALWKFDKKGERTEMVWDSPWGRGFPGWHLECSAMIEAKLGDTIDIHTGGIDHIPVHHTNEIAQSEAAHNKPLAHYWLHTAHLLSEGTKLAKSLGNSFLLQDLADQGFSALDFRMFVSQSHYRTESNFTWENLAAAANRLRNWQNIASLRWQTYDTLQSDAEKSSDELSAAMQQAREAILLALQDDLESPQAFRIIDELFATIERTPLADIQQTSLRQLLETIDELFGLQLLETTPDVSEEVKLLIIERQRAREAKDWARSDKLREQLAHQHIGIHDTAHGSIWYRL